MPALQIGVVVSDDGRADAKDIPGYARHAEQLGLDSVSSVTISPPPDRCWTARSR
jgi:hypothetical protein